MAYKLPHRLPTYDPNCRSEDKQMLGFLECELRDANMQLHRIDDADYHAFQTRRAECRLDRVMRQQEEERLVVDSTKLQFYAVAVEAAEWDLECARDRMARFTADRQRFIAQRRPELTRQIELLHVQIARYRQWLDMPPLLYPLEPPRREEQKEQLSPTTPTQSTATLSVLKRRPITHAM